MVEAKINDLIFRELIKRGYSLKGNTRVWNIADSKLWYLTPEQAQAYLDLEESEEYDATSIEYDLLSNYSDMIKKEIKSGAINIVDLGCGDGKKTAFLIKKMLNTNSVRYCPIDISGYMVQKAIKTVSKINVKEIIESKWNISDFENLQNITPLLRREKKDRNLFLLLGYTLGNFEIHDILYQIRSSMRKGDVLVIVTGIGNEKWEKWISKINDEKKLRMDSFFNHIPLQIGFEMKAIEFGARFQNSRVEYFHTLKKDKTVNLRDKSVEFKKGDEIIVAVSYKHDKDDLTTYLNMHFDQVDVFPSDDGSTALAICKRRV
ncbi:MAG: L-histidine N(alpha)-methyltransferase [Nanoarchaeota archaeon]|nr:L-histidine N(alpha)-methyltransferase [Nanoarchaeota archaeon]MBU1051525.1 L-histidine N(alpha)-methyltransferase [Nanoarchaeota archaeon]